MKDAPTLETFLAATEAEIAPFAPETLIYAAAGTRRSAALHGLSSTDDAFAQWTHGQMLATCDLIFRHGVRDIFTILATPGQFAEVGPYRQRLVAWIEWAFASEEASAALARYGWKIKLWSGGTIPELRPLEQQTNAASAGASQTLWCLAVASVDALWQHILSSVVACQATTQAAAIAACYGQDVAPATLYLGFGKPVLAPDLLSPLLMGKLHCYWTQRPGYRLSEEEFRRILYDRAFLRTTWQTDKTRRGEEALAARAAWERGPILGLGRRLGPFWYPQEFSMPAGEGESA